MADEDALEARQSQYQLASFCIRTLLYEKISELRMDGLYGIGFSPHTYF